MMSGYSEMLAQGRKFAEERKEKTTSAAKRRGNVDDLAASLLGDLERNIYQRPSATDHEISGVTDSVTSGATDGATVSATDGAIAHANATVSATDGATDGAINGVTCSASNSVPCGVTDGVESTVREMGPAVCTASRSDAKDMDPAHWTENERRVFNTFSQSRDHLFSYPALSTKLGIPPSTIRRIAERFEAAGLISRKRLVKGRIRGVEITIVSQSGVTDGAINGVQNSVTCGAINGAVDGAQNHAYKEEIDKIDLSISIWNTSYEEMQAMWPHVCAIGFTPVHLRQLQQIFAIQRFESATVALSLRYLDWQLEHSGGHLCNPKGDPVSDPIAYWLASMRRNGYYNKPKGYVDPLVAARRLLLEQEREEAEVERALEETRRQRKAVQSNRELDSVFAAILEQGEAHPLYAAFLEALPGVLQTQVQTNGLARLSGPGAKAGVHMALETVLKRQA